MKKGGGTITNVKKYLSAAPDTAQRNGRNAQVGSNVMLRNPLQDLGVMFQQFTVACFGVVFDAGEEKFLIKKQPLKKHLIDLCFDGGRVVQYSHVVFFADGMDYTRLYAFDAE